MARRSTIKPAGSPRAGSAGDSSSNEQNVDRRAGMLTNKEHRAQGVVSTEVLGAYARALGGVPVFAFLLSLYVLTECVRVASSIWLSVWTSDDNGCSSGSKADDLLGFVRERAGELGQVVGRRHTPMFYLGVFCAISVSQVLHLSHACTNAL